MLEKKKVLKITLWWGIIADAVETVRMTFPQVFIKTGGFDIKVTDEFRFALLYGMPVMLGWTILLYWAQRNPIERKGTYLCLIPVILAYFVVEIVGIRMDLVSFEKMIPTFFLQAGLLSLTVWSYRIAQKMKS